MHHLRRIVFLMLLPHIGFASASIGVFLPFSPFPIFYNTVEPINIDTSRTYPFKSFVPLTLFGDSRQEEANLQNSGTRVIVTLEKNYTTNIITGGVLGKKFYALTRMAFRWTNKTNNGVSYTTINGENGAPLTALTLFYNLDYPSYEEALKYRNGIAKISVRVDVGSKRNPKFDKFAEKMKEIRKTGSSASIKLSDVFSWYLNFPPDVEYFAYPGSVFNVTTDSNYYCSTTIVGNPSSLPSISRDQFEKTFLKELNIDGDPYINPGTQSPQGIRPVARSKGIKMISSSKIFPSVTGS